MGSFVDELLGDDFDCRFDDFKEEVVRRKHGNPRYTESLSAIVSRDSRTAGSDTTRGGLEQSRKRVQVERKWLIEVAASQEINSDDTFVIGDRVWKILGDSIGSDGGSKTYVLVARNRGVSRFPSLNSGD